MRSTFAGLNTVVRGLYAQQVGLDTVGHNISNATTDGYSRQLVSLAATKPESVYGGSAMFEIGSGVDVTAIKRARDTFLDQQYWKENSSLGYGETMETTLGKIEGVFAEPTENGIQSVLDKFWSSWQTLATNASDNASRTAVRERGVELVDAIQHSAQQLKDMVTDVNTVLNLKLDSLNQMTSEILSLNKQIMSVEAGGLSNANDLRDRRDYLVDQIAKMAGINVSEDKAGNYTVQLNGITLVDGYSTTQLTTKSSIDPDYGYEVRNIVVAGSNQPVTVTNGELKGLVDSRDSAEKGAKKYLNELANISKFLLQEFNAVHRSGLGTDNSTGTNFFGEGGTNPDYQASAMTNGDWIKQLAVNTDLFATDGLAKIAAKTSADSVAVISNGTASVTTTGTYTGTADTTSITVTMTASGFDWSYVDSSGNTQTGSSTAGPAGSITGVEGLTVAVDFTGSMAGAKYTFAVSKDNKVSDISKVIPAVPATVTTTGSYTGGATPTPVAVSVAGGNITYSYDDDGTPVSVTVASSPPPEINVKGLTVTLDFSSCPDGDYTLSLSQGNNASGDNAVKLGNRLKVDTSASLGNASLDTYYSSMIGALGIQKQNTSRLADNQQALIDQVNNSRENVKGVNLDEEMTNMIRFQQGYNSAARVITVIDEMLDKLINGTGVVGR
ncbi:flagellar hook-associated protein FlgK|uniref:Flagellar hook-associated protein 1 n=1 Tax=Dendrosporobacter quercicolus TaxID=146817 RepID=A0A1G9WTF7_9FIRM|nr:flagellar hook-associated protein FlgK [Dendrosporobacter quercicolus]NSL49210.1 flagellar hook-associated protein FlgK [Dendrosporobacter quercicolus DSM 1736]SDM87842.1 flagellar hook-associated protein 1 FlgK [Dendrosporobacter quercicolus]